MVRGLGPPRAAPGADPVLAAQYVNWLVLSIPLNKAMAYATDEPLFTAAELDAYADEAVRIFLAAYAVAG